MKENLMGIDIVLEYVLSYLLGLDMRLLDRIKQLDQNSLRELDSQIRKEMIDERTQA